MTNFSVILNHFYQALATDESEDVLPLSTPENFTPVFNTPCLKDHEVPELARGKTRNEKMSRPRLSTASQLLQGLMFPVRKVRKTVSKKMGKAKRRTAPLNDLPAVNGKLWFYANS